MLKCPKHIKRKEWFDLNFSSLTDEKIRKNWEEFGNPDGIRSFALGVALPSWLVNSGNRVILLALYCIAFGIGLPLLVKQWWSKSKKYTKDGLRNSSMTMFFHDLKENSSLKRIIEMIACASEFADELPAHVNISQRVKDLVKALETYEDPHGDRFELPKKVVCNIEKANDDSRCLHQTLSGPMHFFTHTFIAFHWMTRASDRTRHS